MAIIWTICDHLISIFRAVLTPFASMVPAVFSKTIACVDPWVYAISHPKFREGVHNMFPWLISAAAHPQKKCSDNTSQQTAASVEEK